MSIYGKENLIEDILHVSDYVKSINEYTAILTHYDADGIAAGGSFTRLFANKKIPFIIRVASSLDQETLREFFEINADNYIILDLGSELRLITKIANEYDKLGKKGILIIDHHKSSEFGGKSDKVILLNPEIYGVDGGREGCTSIISSLVTYYASDKEDSYLLQLGIIGGVGDMQLQENISGINRLLVHLAEEERVISVRREFIFFLNRKLPLYKALTWVFIPYIPEFSGRDDIGINIMERAGIPIEINKRRTTIEDISEKDKERLLEVILKYLSSKNIRITANELVRYTFELLNENIDVLSTAEDFMNLLSALGRMGKEAEAILIASGARGKMLEEALNILEKRRKLLREYLELAFKKAEYYENENIVLIDLRNEEFNSKFSGSISTILSKSLKFKEKIIIVLSIDESGKVKISSRAPRTFVNLGYDLSKVMRKVAEAAGGVGGGHNIAAGASVSNIDKLKNIVIEIAGEELRRILK